MAEVDKRSVHTDALQTLGSIIGKGEKRDAIHLAVEPVVAGDNLNPGQHVGRKKDGTFGDASKFLGIVDPFIRGRVSKGQRFWLVVYPRQITALHHVWEHPDFPEPIADTEAQVKKVTERLTRTSETWIREHFLPNFTDLDYDDVMEVAKARANGGDGWATSGHDLDYDFIGKNIDEFWHHFSNVTGIAVPENRQGSFFTCSC